MWIAFCNLYITSTPILPTSQKKPMACRGHDSPKFTRLLNSKAGRGSWTSGSFRGSTLPTCMGTCKYHQAHMRTKPTDAVYCNTHLLDEQMLDCSQRGFCRHTGSSQIPFNPSASGFLPAKRRPALLLGVRVGVRVSWMCEHAFGVGWRRDGEVGRVSPSSWKWWEQV